MQYNCFSIEYHFPPAVGESGTWKPVAIKFSPRHHVRRLMFGQYQYPADQCSPLLVFLLKQTLVVFITYSIVGLVWELALNVNNNGSGFVA